MKRFARLVLWGWVLAIWSVSWALAEPFAQEWVTSVPLPSPKIRQAMQDRNYAEAVKAIDEAAQAKDAPRDYLAYLKGWALYLSKQYDPAIATLDEVEKQFPKSPWARRARFAKALALVRKGDFREAELIYRAEAEFLLSVERRRQLAGIYLEFADAAFQPPDKEQKPDYQKALEFYRRALEVGTTPEKQQEAELRIAECHVHLSQLGQAVELYTEFLKDHPQSPLDLEARYRLGECQQKSGQLKEARRTWQDLLAKYPDAKSERIAEASFHLAATWRVPAPQSDEELNLGTAALSAFLERFPAHKLAGRAQLELAKSYLHRGRHEDAAQALVRFLKDERYRDRPEVPEACSLLGATYRDQKKFDEALATWQDFLAKYPTHEAWSAVQKEIVDTEYLRGADQYAAKQYEAAVKLWSEFMARHPLDGRNPSILYVFGEIESRQKKPDAAIAAWRRLAEKYPNTGEAVHALFSIAQTLEEQGRLEEALEAYRKVPPGNWSGQAANAVARLTGVTMTVASPRIFRSDETPRLVLTTRNVESVTVRAYQVDLETYFRKMHQIRGVEQLDIALIDPDRSLEFKVPGYAKHQEIQSTIELPLPGEARSGVMAVTVSSETLEATTLMIQSDLDILLKGSRDEAFVFAENMRTGKPWAGVRLLVSDGAQIVAQATTDAQGIGRAPLDKIAMAQDLRVFALADGHIASTESPLGEAAGQRLSDRGYLDTDLPVYTAGAAVHVRGCVRRVADDAYTIENGKAYTLAARDSRDRPVHEQKVTLGPLGAFAAEFDLPPTCPQGTYRLVLRDDQGHTYQGSFRVVRFAPELVRLQVDTPRRVYYRGEEIEGTIRASFYYGAAVAGREIQYQVEAGPVQTVTTDAKGEVRFKIPTREYDETQVLRLQVTLPEQNLQATARFFLATLAYSIEANTVRPVFIADEPFEVTVKTRDAEGKPTAQKLALRVLERTEADGKVGEKQVQEHPVETGADGLGRISLKIPKGGRYALRVEGTDRFKNPVSTQTKVEISDDKDENRLRILADRHTYRAGDVAEVVVHWREAPALALVTYEGGRVLDHRLVELANGANKLAIPMTARLAPNFNLAVAVMIDPRPEAEKKEGKEQPEPARSKPRRFHTAASPLAVERDLNVTLACQRKGGAGPIRPGEAVEVTVTTTDPQQKPVPAEVSLTMVHQSLADRFAWPAGSIEAFFRAQARASTIHTASSIVFADQPQTQAIHPRLLAERQRAQLAAEEEASRRRDPFADGPSMLAGAEGRPSRIHDPITAGVELSEGEVFADGKAARFGGAMGGESLAERRDPSGGLAVPAELLAGGGGARAGYWNPAIVTGADGKATVTVTLPEESTAWTLRARGITADTLAGEASHELVVRKELFGQLKLPAAFTEGDQAEVIATVHNDLVAEGPIEVVLRTTLGGQTTEDRRTLQVKSKGIEEVFVKVSLARPPAPADKPEPAAEAFAARFELTVAGGGATDVLRRAVPVLPYGAPVFASASGSATADTIAWVEMPKGPVAGPRMQIVVGPTVERSLLDILFEPAAALPPPVEGSTEVETAASDLMAAIGLQKLLGVSREADAPVAQDLDARVRAALGLLLMAQNDDGSWSWTGRCEESDRFSTARALWAVSLARKAGYPVPDEALEKALGYVRTDASSLDNTDYEARAILLHVQAVSGEADFAVVNHLHRERAALSPVAKAYLALTLVEMNRKAMAAEVLGLTATPNLDNPASWSFEEQSSLLWGQGVVELYALRALAAQAVAPKSPKTKEMVDWLLAHRSGRRWAPDKATGSAALALCQWFAESRFEGQRYQLAVLVNDRPAATLDVDPAAGSRVIDVPSALLVPGRQKVQFQLTGRARYAYQCVMSGFVPADQLKSTASGWEVRRYYEQAPLQWEGEDVPRGFGIVQGRYAAFRNPLAQLPVARRGLVMISVKRTAQSAESGDDRREPLVVIEPVPAGAAVIESTIRGGFDRYEIVPGAIVFYVGARPTIELIRYELHGYLPGAYRMAPTLARNAYRPEQLAVAAPATLAVLPLGAKSGDKYRLTPHELYDLATRLKKKGDLKTAGQHLAELLSQWNLRPEAYKSAVEMLLEIHLQLGPPKQVVHYFEIIKEKWPEKEIPFAEIVKVGAAYHELGEFERSYYVFRATVESSFARESGMAGFLESQGEFLRSVDLMGQLLREYPPEPYVAEADYALAQQVALKAPGAADDPKLRERKVNRVDLIQRASRMLEGFLAAYPEDPAADQAAFSAASALLELQDYAAAAAACTRYAARYPESDLLDSFLYMLGYCRFAAGEHKEALEVCRKVAEIQRVDKETGRLGDSPNKWRAIYILGQIHHSLGEFAEAIREYRRVEDRFSDAKLSIAYFLRKSIQLPEVTTVKPGEKAEVELKFSNLPDCDVKVYRIDLMKYSLLRGDLGGIARINLAGIRPLHEATVKLGEGQDYRERTQKLPLPVEKEGAYLVVGRGENLHASGLVLVTPLSVEVQTDPGSGQVRAMVKDTVTGRYTSGVQVRVIGSGMDQFVAGKTDLRGVFVADQVQGAPTVIALADGGRYAFYRSPAILPEQEVFDPNLARAPRPASPQPRASRPLPAAMDLSGLGSRGKDVREALQQPTQLEFVETPLEDVVAYLRDYHGIEIQLDRKALGDVGISPDTPITRNVRGVSLRDGLRLMLRDLDLMYVPRDNVLLITTPEEAETMLATVVYPVGDLVMKQGRADFDSLIDLVTSSVKPSTWDEVGGPGSIAPVESNLSLVVSQTHEVQDEVAALLAKLRQSAGIAADPASQGLAITASGEGSKGLAIGVSEAEQRINAVLDSPTAIQVAETPLADVVDLLKRQHGIEIQIDQKALDDVGIGTDSPVTRDLQGVTLRSALELILRDLDLTFHVQNEVLQITTPEEAETRLKTVLYPVGDLAGDYRDPSTGESWADYQSLIDLITTAVSPTAWDEVGGPGGVGVFEKSQSLVVSQTEDVHRQVAQLLDTLRRAGKTAGGAQPVTKTRPQMPEGFGMGGMGGMGMGGGMGSFGGPAPTAAPGFAPASRQAPTVTSVVPVDDSSGDLLGGLQDANRRIQGRQAEKLKSRYQGGMGGFGGGVGAGAAF